MGAYFFFSLLSSINSITRLFGARLHISSSVNFTGKEQGKTLFSYNNTAAAGFLLVLNHRIENRVIWIFDSS